MLAIRLQRIGKNKFATYRLIVSEKTKDTWGTYLEQIGTFNPHAKENQLVANEERVKYWLSKGAQPSDTLHNLFVKAGLMTGKKKKSVFISKKRATKLAEKKKAA
jgi:small subunit ribosomal protein S16